MPFCHTDHEKPSRLDADLEKLFSVVTDAVALPHLTPEAQAYIDSYLQEEQHISASPARVEHAETQPEKEISPRETGSVGG